MSQGLVATPIRFTGSYVGIIPTGRIALTTPMSGESTHFALLRYCPLKGWEVVRAYPLEQDEWCWPTEQRQPKDKGV
jgi:hypothetical protein